jgi:hypothetical protein
MKTLSIQQKVYGAIAILSLLVVIAGAVIDHYSSKIADDALVMDALGRQRMLTQAMGKAAFGYSLAKGRLKTIDVTVGKVELNASLDEYETAKKIFAQTLRAAKVGGKYPADLKMTKMSSIEAIGDSEIQETIGHVEVEFGKFVKQVRSLVDAKVNSDPYRKAQSPLCQYK